MRTLSLGALCAACALLGGCYSLDRRDIFEVAFHAPAPAALANLSDARHKVRPLELAGLARPVSAYWDDGQDAKGFLIFFNGNGYGAEAAMRRMLTPARALGLDLVVFDYYEAGEPPPTMSQMRAVADALYDASAKRRTGERRRIFVGGHSLGCTFALELAADRPVDGTFIAAPATTGISMIHHELPYSRLAWLRQDADYAQFDNLKLAPRVTSPVLVAGSQADQAVPPAFTHAVYAALGGAARRREVILTDSPHSEYFARDAFWRAVSEFFGLPLTGEPVGYIKPRA